MKEYSRTRSALESLRNRLWPKAAALGATAAILAGCDANSSSLPDRRPTESVSATAGTSALELITNQLKQCGESAPTYVNLSNEVEYFETNNNLSDASSIALGETYKVPVFCEANLEENEK